MLTTDFAATGLQRHLQLQFLVTLLRGISLSLFAAGVSGCAGYVNSDRDTTAIDRSDTGDRQILDVARLLVDGWTELQFKGRTQYFVAVWDGNPVLRAVGNQSASGFIRSTNVSLDDCPFMRWAWRVNTLQPSADIRVKAKEDVAASIFLLFGDPGMLFDPSPVPTLRYVWSSQATPQGSVVDNPYLPGVVKSVVVRSGHSDLGRWVSESRNVADDFIRAFGKPPDAPLQAVAIFTDNDQTLEPVEAIYGEMWSVCSKQG